MILNKNIFLSTNFWRPKVGKSLLMPKGDFCAGDRHKTTVKIGVGLGRQCTNFPLIAARHQKSSVQVFRKLEYNLPICYHLRFTGKQTNASVEYKPCEL